jgi:hypothetical protein
MQKDIIRIDGDLKREIWYFDLTQFSGELTLLLSYYRKQTRRTNRCRNWDTQINWSRILTRDNDIETPPLPEDVEREIRAYYEIAMKELPLKMS